MMQQWQLTGSKQLAVGCLEPIICGGFLLIFSLAEASAHLIKSGLPLKAYISSKMHEYFAVSLCNI